MLVRPGLMFGKGGRFSPRRVPNLALWIDAGLSPNTLNSGAVSQINDLSGNGRNLSQGTAANQPLLVAGAVNGFPSIRFDGTNDSLVSASIAGQALFGASQCAVFAVMKQDGTSTTSDQLISWSDGVTPVQILTAFTDDSLYFDYGNFTSGSGRLSVAQPTGWDDTWHVVEMVRQADGTQIIMVDGVSLASASRTGTIGSGSATMSLGAGTLKGDVAALAIVAADPGAAVRARLRRYLGARYGITVS